MLAPQIEMASQPLWEIQRRKRKYLERLLDQELEIELVFYREKHYPRHSGCSCVRDRGQITGHEPWWWVTWDSAAELWAAQAGAVASFWGGGLLFGRLVAWLSLPRGWQLVIQNPV